MNLDKYADVGTHWIDLHCIDWFKFFILIVLVLNMFLKKFKNLFGIKNIIANIFRVQANDSVVCGYFCIGFIDFMLAGKKIDWLY